MSDREFMARVTVERLDTHERIDFLGQGRTVADCVSDGAKSLKEPFRPSSSGAKNSPLPLQITAADGTKRWGKLDDFEKPAAAPAPAKKAEVFDV